MTTEICKHCNGWRGLHKWDTMQCPYMGAENENWQTTTYEEADETAAATITAQAARIAELEARVKELEAGLRPFAHPDLCAKRSGNTEGDASPIFGRDKAVITLGDCRRARALLETK